MKAVIDTNVLMSGVFWGGTPAKIIDAYLQKRFEWIVSADILDEYWRVLGTLVQKYNPPPEVSEFFRTLSLTTTIVVPVSFSKPVCTDSTDDKFLEAAVAAAGCFIATGDSALLKTNGFKGIQVVKPSEFLKEVARLSSK
jgi:uncharacterized protein